MEDVNGIYPVPIRRHEADCKGCLEPWACDCECAVCVKSKEDYLDSQIELLKLLIFSR